MTVSQAVVKIQKLALELATEEVLCTNNRRIIVRWFELAHKWALRHNRPALATSLYCIMQRPDFVHIVGFSHE